VAPVTRVQETLPPVEVVDALPDELDPGPEPRPTRTAASVVGSVPSGDVGGVARPPSQASELRADEMLRRAQDLLADGQRQAAIRAYRELVTRHGTSAEARAALVSLGDLLLAEGDAREALGYFERYVRAGGPLGEEARYGRIEALSRVGQRDVAIDAIDDFLRRYPNSVHAERLRTKVGVLRGD